MPENVLDAKMTLETGKFQENLAKAREGTSKMLETFKTVGLGLTGLGGAFAAFRGAEAITEGLKGAIEQGRQFAVQARQASQSVATMVELKRAFQEAGLGADGVNTSLFMLNRALGGVNEEGQPTDAAFRRIGLSIADLRKQDAVAQFQAIIGGLNKLPDAASRANDAQKIFGRGARDIMGILNDPAGFNESIKGSLEYAKTMQANAGAFERVGKAVEQVQMKVEEFYSGVAAGLAPILEKVLALVNKIDFAKFGADIGKIFAIGFEAFKEGKVWDIVKLGLTVAFEESVNKLLGALSGIGDVLSGAIQAAFNADTMGGLSEMFLGVAEAFGSALLTAGAKLTDYLSTGMEYWLNKATASAQILKLAHERSGVVSQYDQATTAAKQSAAQGDTSGAQAHQKEADALWGQINKIDEKGKRLGDVLSMNYADFLDKHGTDKTASNFTSAPAAQLDAQSAAHLKEGAVKFVAAVQPVTDALGRLGKTANSVNVFGQQLADAKDKLKRVVSGLTQNVGAGATPDKDKTSDTKTLAPTEGYKLPESDRLQRIGLFIGGSPAAPGLSEARRTATATEKMAAMMDKFTGKIPVSYASSAPGYFAP